MDDFGSCQSEKIYPSLSWDKNKRRDEAELLNDLNQIAELDAAQRGAIVQKATELVQSIRNDTSPGLMEVFLAEYGLSTKEGIALMCLAEALLRVPDSYTIDALIDDKIASSNWSKHLGNSTSPLVNASTWSLLITGKILNDDTSGIKGTLHSMTKRLGEPLVRVAVGKAMQHMGRQFVLGETIQSAMKRAKSKEAEGFTYSYDMLGEAAMTQADANTYATSYANAISALSAIGGAEKIADNPSISVKLSALHPRYEVSQTQRVLKELVPIVKQLALQAAQANLGFTIDAEEADRLALSLEVIEAVLSDESLKGWDGFGVVIQAYGRRTGDVIKAVYDMAERYDRKIAVRLVKGAYWDTEIKHAQVEGLDDFPVLTRKSATDVSYIANARRLLRLKNRIYPQFATHNAHTVAAILHMVQQEGLRSDQFEFQRLHGMGESVHDIVHRQEKTKCRIYAPVGSHRDLLAYLVRRLLENGANSSFVNQIVDENTPAEVVAACPFEKLAQENKASRSKIKTGPELFSPSRPNSKGFDIFDANELHNLEQQRQQPVNLSVSSIIAGPMHTDKSEDIISPINAQKIGTVQLASQKDVDTAISAAQPWTADQASRAQALNRAADLFEQDYATCFSLLCFEAGKTLPDAIGELREAVDFLRYYAQQSAEIDNAPRGIFTCISPWNFPLAIFSGQIAAALATGNAVLAKPAETTPAIAQWAVQHFHTAGVPVSALQLLSGYGRDIGAQLTSRPEINGVAFTGSTQTAKHIQKALANHATPGTPLIAETGGLNAMIIDSTALPEQAVRDVIASAFQSAGQRCSALRCLYVQEEIYPQIKEMICGAMNELSVGNPQDFSTDIGPLISQDAQHQIQDYIDQAGSNNRLLHTTNKPSDGFFVAPSLIKVDGISDLSREIFGPVLHIATYKASQIDKVIQAINDTGYGLTFGLHTRIDARVEKLSQEIKAGNVYVNRNQIGAIVGSQPFGGEGLSGTGPKAGGPRYLERFVTRQTPSSSATVATIDDPLSTQALEALIQEKAHLARSTVKNDVLPGPTGELNQITTSPRSPILCLGPSPEAAQRQAQHIEAHGGIAYPHPQNLAPAALTELTNIGGILWWGDEQTARQYAQALCDRKGAIVPLITGMPDAGHALQEKHLCVDTTAAGGNANLLAGLE